MRNKSVFLLLVINIFTVIKCQDDFDYDFRFPCKLAAGGSGLCAPLNTCQSAVESEKRNEPPVPCWNKGLNRVICCPSTEKLIRPEEPKISKSEQKCSEYQRNVNIMEQVEPLTIVGGSNAPPRLYPHMAVLGFGRHDNAIWGCGGSLISDKFILTAGHCLISPDVNFFANIKLRGQGQPSNECNCMLCYYGSHTELNERCSGKNVMRGEIKFVRLGDLNLKIDTDDADPQDFKVVRRIKHPDYNPPSQYHDIALLELDKPVRITEHVRPACIHNKREVNSTTWTATGWGNLEFGGKRADHLQVVLLKEFTKHNCSKSFPPGRRLANGIDDSLQICAGDAKMDTCQGDSGGPLQIPNYFDGFRIIGITSFGKACGITKAPGVYTRVSNYVDWIESIVWPN